MSSGASPDTDAPAGADLRPFVPRGSLQWLRDDPGTVHRRFDASLLFVDVSGFTAMSERLARLGRLGAEEVTDLLNLTFRELLSVAYEDDGSLLKFGGDALLLQFDGDAHAHRAVHAAVGMRRALRSLQPLASSVGQVHLRMSLGVHTGPVDQFLVGTHHRELLLVGPGVSSVVRMESAAGAGQIVVSQGVVDRLGDALATVPFGPGHRLRAAVPLPPSGPGSALPAGTADVAPRLLPTEVRTRLAAGAATAEHRLGVIGFVAFSGTDALLEREGPEATADALARLVDLVDETTARDGVCLLATDVAVDGGKFILTAGVPTATESDGERMLRALRRLVDADPPVPLRVGVHAGRVFAGVVGPPFRLTYTVIGDAVNLAARVMGHARPETVLATPDVLNRSQALFDVTPVPPFTVKGKRKPVEAMEVGEVVAVRARRPGARFPLAGRREELAALLDACDAADGGPGQVVQLLGPAGLGKSRLVDELHQRRPGRELVIAECSRYEAATPYHVVGRLARDHLGLAAGSGAAELAEAVQAQAPHLAAALPLLGDVVGIEVADTADTRDLTSAFRADRVRTAAADLVHALLPVDAVLVVEDAHWLDLDSSRVFADLLDRLLVPSERLVVLTARAVVLLVGDDDPRGRLLPLQPLGELEARELVYSAAEEGIVTLAEGMQLLERAGGNPFFLQELLRVRQDGRELPEDVEALVQSDLDTLHPDDRVLLGYAAVLGEEVDPALFAAVTGIAQDQQAAVWARLEEFLAPTTSGTRRFRHALVRDGAYVALPFRRRRELHRRAADVLARSATSRADLLALHTFEAGDFAAAHRHALAAAEEASHRYANLTAAEHYRRAVEAGRRVRDLGREDLARTWERLGDALLLAAAYDDAVAAYRRAKELADPGQQVHLCAQIGQLRERQARYREALWWYSRGISLDRAAATGEAARLLVESGLVRIRQGRPSEALDLASRAGRVATATPDRARVSYVRAWARMLLGQDPREDAAQTLALFRRAGDLIGEGLAWNIISMAAYHRGDWGEAATAYDQARTLRRRVGDEVAAAVATGNLGELLADQGHGDRARPLLEEAHAVCAAAGYVAGEQFVAMTLGRLAAREGRYEEAATWLHGARMELERRGAAELVHHVRLRQAELALFRGDLDAAAETASALEAASELGGTGLRAGSQRVRTGVAVRRGEVDRAREEAELLLAQLADDDEDYETALALVTAAAALAAAGDDRAPRVQARATELLDRLGVVVPGERLALGPDVDLVSSSSPRHLQST